MAAWSDHDSPDGTALCPICRGAGKLARPPISCSSCHGTGRVTRPNFGVPRKLFFVLHKLLEMDDSDA